MGRCKDADDLQRLPQQWSAVPVRVQQGRDVAIRAYQQGIRIGGGDAGVKHVVAGLTDWYDRQRKPFRRRRPHGMAFFGNQQCQVVAIDQIQAGHPPVAILEPDVRQAAAGAHGWEIEFWITDWRGSRSPIMAPRS